MCQSVIHEMKCHCKVKFLKVMRESDLSTAGQGLNIISISKPDSATRQAETRIIILPGDASDSLCPSKASPTNFLVENV